jgi:hypothetical protein
MSRWTRSDVVAWSLLLALYAVSCAALFGARSFHLPAEAQAIDAAHIALLAGTVAFMAWAAFFAGPSPEAKPLFEIYDPLIWTTLSIGAVMAIGPIAMRDPVLFPPGTKGLFAVLAGATAIWFWRKGRAEKKDSRS